jgi:hypothetical protein
MIFFDFFFFQERFEREFRVNGKGSKKIFSECLRNFSECLRDINPSGVGQVVGNQSATHKFIKKAIISDGFFAVGASRLKPGLHFISTGFEPVTLPPKRDALNQ